MQAHAVAKRTMDLMAAAAGLVVLSPLLLAIGFLVRVSSPGPILFRQERVGQGGKHFWIYKFRTMRTGAPGPAITSSGDRRVTAIGRYLRRYKLDELAQLLNVLKGEMSLVGPRPEVAKYVDLYPDEWREIHTVKPGLTDFAAIAFVDEEEVLARAPDPERTYIEDVLPRKLALYREYIARQSIRTDLALIVRTLRRMTRW